MKWLLKRTKFIWPGIFAMTFIGAVISVMGVLFALLSKDVLDIATGQTEGNLLSCSLLLFVFLIAQLLLEIFQSVTTVHITGRFNIRFKTDLFRTVLSRDYMKLTEYHTGELLNRINSDVSIIATGLTQMLPNLVFYLTKIVSCFWVLYLLDPHFALLCLCLGPLIFITAQIYRKKVKHLHKESQAADGSVKSFMQETLKNILVIKSFGRGVEAAEKSRVLQDKLFRLNIRKNNISILANVFFYLALTAGYYFALAWGAYKISKGLMTFGTMTALLQLVNQIQAPFQGLSGLFPQYYAMIASAERLVELEQLPEDRDLDKADWNGEAWS